MLLMRRIFLWLMALVFAMSAGCRRQANPRPSISKNTVEQKAPIIREAERLRIRETEEFRTKLAKVSDDLLIEGLFERWAAEDSKPGNLAKCYQEHKQEFGRHYRRVYSLVDPAAPNADALLDWRRKLQKGEDFRLLAASGCKADSALCGVRGDLGYLDTGAWFQNNGLTACTEFRVTLNGQELYGPCKTAQGFGYFMLTDDRVIIPTLEEIGKSLQETCVTLSRASRISALSEHEQNSEIQAQK